MRKTLNCDVNAALCILYMFGVEAVYLLGLISSHDDLNQSYASYTWSLEKTLSQKIWAGKIVN